jgi:hypothetical protein
VNEMRARLDRWMNYALICSFAQILDVLHKVDGIVRQPLRSLSMREDTNKVKNGLVFP